MKATAPKQIEFETLAQEASSSEASKGSEGSLSPEKAKALEQRQRIARRAAKELKDGFHVNLGIGMPTLVPEVSPSPDVRFRCAVRLTVVLVSRTRGEGVASERERDLGYGPVSDEEAA